MRQNGNGGWGPGGETSGPGVRQSRGLAGLIERFFDHRACALTAFATTGRHAELATHVL